MQTERLLKRRQDVIDRHRVLESVPGSGYHPNDADSRERARKGEAPLSERPVALLDDDRIHVAGPDAAAVRAALARHVESFGGAPLDRADEKYALQISRRVAASGGELLTLPTREWNACLLALAHQGVQVVLADANG